MKGGPCGFNSYWKLALLLQAYSLQAPHTSCLLPVGGTAPLLDTLLPPQTDQSLVWGGQALTLSHS